MLTTHRIIWFKQTLALEIPLFYVFDYSKGVTFSHLLISTTLNLALLIYNYLSYSFREDFSIRKPSSSSCATKTSSPLM